MRNVWLQFRMLRAEKERLGSELRRESTDCRVGCGPGRQGAESRGLPFREAHRIRKRMLESVDASLDAVLEELTE